MNPKDYQTVKDCLYIAVCSMGFIFSMNLYSLYIGEPTSFPFFIYVVVMCIIIKIHLNDREHKSLFLPLKTVKEMFGLILHRHKVQLKERDCCNKTSLTSICVIRFLVNSGNSDNICLIASLTFC